MFKQIDNWLPKDLVEYLDNYFLYGFPHFYGHWSVKSGSDMFYSSDLNPNDALNKYLFEKVGKTLDKKVHILRSYINIQHPGMDGLFHSDDGDLTCLYMVTKTLKKGGHFEIKGEKKIPFVQGRFICFDAKKLHRGQAPINKGDVRISLAFKTKYV